MPQIYKNAWALFYFCQKQRPQFASQILRFLKSEKFEDSCGHRVNASVAKNPYFVQIGVLNGTTLAMEKMTEGGKVVNVASILGLFCAKQPKVSSVK